MKKKIIKLLLITTLSTLILTGCKDSEETISNIDETTETTSVIESSEVAENTSDATTETASTSETSETESESDSASAIETSESETDSTTETTTEPVSTSTTETPVKEETKVEYTYTEMNEKMCALSAVNVRDLPSTDGNKVGGLSYGERVVVTGRCNETGWYRIGDGRYVSDKYLVSEADFKPQQTTPSGENNNQSGNTDASTTAQEPICTSAEFIGILNAKRAEAGLSPVSLDGNLDAMALSEVKVLSTNFDGFTPSGNYDRCNRAKSMGSSNAQNVFDAWYNSEGHRRALMDPYLTHIATAYYGNGGYYIFIGNIDEEAYLNSFDTPSTAPVTDPVNSTDVGGGQSVTVEGTPGAVTVVDPNEAQDLKDQWGW